MKDKLFAYKIGLAIVGLFTIVVFLFVLLQAGNAKKDADLTKRANEIANKLNEHMYSASDLPNSLEEAGVKDVPSSITYKKISNETYTFCVDYKSKSSGFDPSNALSSVVSGYYGGGYNSYSDEQTSLYILPDHKEGKNCQTVKPYLYSVNSTDDSTAPYELCGVDYNYSWASLPVQQVTAKSGSSNASISVESVPANTFQIDPDAKIFDRDCKELALSDLQAGSWVDLYFNPYGSPVVMIVKQS
jgi:hypothetical protein